MVGGIFLLVVLWFTFTSGGVMAPARRSEFIRSRGRTTQSHLTRLLTKLYDPLTALHIDPLTNMTGSSSSYER